MRTGCDPVVIRQQFPVSPHDVSIRLCFKISFLSSAFYTHEWRWWLMNLLHILRVVHVIIRRLSSKLVYKLSSPIVFILFRFSEKRFRPSYAIRATCPVYRSILQVITCELPRVSLSALNFIVFTHSPTTGSGCSAWQQLGYELVIRVAHHDVITRVSSDPIAPRALIGLSHSVSNGPRSPGFSAWMNGICVHQVLPPPLTRNDTTRGSSGFTGRTDESTNAFHGMHVISRSKTSALLVLSNAACEWLALLVLIWKMSSLNLSEEARCLNSSF